MLCRFAWRPATCSGEETTWPRWGVGERGEDGVGREHWMKVWSIPHSCALYEKGSGACVYWAWNHSPIRTSNLTCSYAPIACASAVMASYNITVVLYLEESLDFAWKYWLSSYGITSGWSCINCALSFLLTNVSPMSWVGWSSIDNAVHVYICSIA